MRASTNTQQVGLQSIFRTFFNFSPLVAQNAPAESKGTSLTIVNCIGFSITIISIQLINALRTENNMQHIYTLLTIGPVLGLLALMRKGNVLTIKSLGISIQRLNSFSRDGMHSIRLNLRW